MGKAWLAAALTAGSLFATASARDAVDLSGLDRGAPGPRAQVLVLGSVHLSQGTPKNFDLASLRPLLDRLAAYRPDIVAVETISGEGCDLMARHPHTYGTDALDTYCSETSDARAALGLDRPEALAQAAASLRAWPAAPTPAQRRRLAALFLAAGEQASAMAQWLQLAPSERRSGDGLDAKLAARLGKLENAPDEGLQIGARLAARLGLQRVYGMDDHTGDNIDVADPRAFGAAVQRAWDAAEPGVRADRARLKALREDGDALALYRFVNDAARLRKEAAADAGAALRDPSPEHYGQQYVAGWETRNLRMAANIRETFRKRPGARVLTVVGAMHKPWLDSLLGQMQNADIVDADKALADPAR
ncbi:DUF5694 domain-containing protein [Lysobacter sp. K5869]|uniref:DUF5694 domain-containing protein n=1 Tax=Lysobacter sp. K5869 TaxID=2820808 RepID=UPI0031F2F89E